LSGRNNNIYEGDVGRKWHKSVAANMRPEESNDWRFVSDQAASNFCKEILGISTRPFHDPGIAAMRAIMATVWA
jgi:hypothetical protein